MSKNGKLNCPDDNVGQEDIQWFENYEKLKKIDHFERLQNKDILNYIKNIERNCRLEVSSGDEDYASTKRSSNCSVRFSSARVKSCKRIKSKVTSRRKKNATPLKKKIKRSSGCNAMNACIYCSSSRNSRFHGSVDPIVRENSKKNLNALAKSVYRYPMSSSKRDFHKHRESSPRFYGRYSRKNRATWPAVTEITSLEVIKNWSQDTSPNSAINRSKIAEKKSAKDVEFKSTRMRKFHDAVRTDTYSRYAANEKTKERDTRYRVYGEREYTGTRLLDEESDVSDCVNQRLLNKSYPVRDVTDRITRTYDASSKNPSYMERGSSEYCYPVRRCGQPACRGTSSRFNKSTASARPSSLPPSQDEVRPPLKASSTIFRPSIDKSYRQELESKHKSNVGQRQRKPDVLQERESLCYRKQDPLKESGKLCKVVRTCGGKQWLGCCCEGVEQDETTVCSKYCRCPENVNDTIRSNYQPHYRYPCRSNRGARKRNDYTEKEKRFHIRLPGREKSGNNHTRASDLTLSAKENPDGNHSKKTMHDNCTFKKSEISDDDRAICYNDKIELEDLEPYVPLPDDWMDQTRRLSKMAREYRKLSNNLKTVQREATETSGREVLRKRITRRYPSGKEFSFEIRTPRKAVVGNSPELQYDVLQPRCECKEPFHDLPAACVTGSCTCMLSNKNVEEDGTDSLPRTSICCCSSVSSHGENDPVRKLESFCEKVKALNQDVFHKTVDRDPTSINTQPYPCHAECDQRGGSMQPTAQTTRSIKKELLEDSARLRLAKPNYRRGKTNLEKILIYPPRGEAGSPLTLYKKSSNINCRVQGDANTGFRYKVTYVQKFVSPTWLPSLSMEVSSKEERSEECNCSSDYG